MPCRSVSMPRAGPLGSGRLSLTGTQSCWLLKMWHCAHSWGCGFSSFRQAWGAYPQAQKIHCTVCVYCCADVHVSVCLCKCVAFLFTVCHYLKRRIRVTVCFCTLETVYPNPTIEYLNSTVLLFSNELAKSISVKNKQQKKSEWLTCFWVSTHYKSFFFSTLVKVCTKGT